jgi:hypothetical protein
MATIRTSNLTVLKTWLLGGQINEYGNYAEGFNTFCDDICVDDLKDESGQLNSDLIKEAIDSLISQFGDDGFKYYNDTYKFKIPSAKNLSILVKRIKSHIKAGNND